jgi:predicted nucleic acid-binding protein
LKYYLDSSFIVSLILKDLNAQRLLDSLKGDLFTSKLGRSEVVRSLTKFNVDKISQAEEFFERVTLLDITDLVLTVVESYPREITLKTSDAIHVATAGLILEDGDSLATFDKQMATNAERLGIPVLTFS